MACLPPFWNPLVAYPFTEAVEVTAEAVQLEEAEASELEEAEAAQLDEAESVQGVEGVEEEYVESGANWRVSGLDISKQHNG
jgi:hypothetical protein